MFPVFPRRMNKLWDSPFGSRSSYSGFPQNGQTSSTTPITKLRRERRTTWKRERGMGRERKKCCCLFPTWNIDEAAVSLPPKARKIRMGNSTKWTYGETYALVPHSCTESWSHWRAKLRDWAVKQARAGCYFWAALSLIDSKALYIKYKLINGLPEINHNKPCHLSKKSCEPWFDVSLRDLPIIMAPIVLF